MRRLNNPRLWRKLPQHINNPTQTQPNIEAVTLTTGDICQVSGRYRYEEEYDHIRDHPVYFAKPYERAEDLRQYVVLLKGDIAPYFIKMDQHGHTEARVSITWTLFEVF